MAYQDFYIGQRVRIREWDDMEKEFGLTRVGSINCDLGFTTDMKHLCGSEVTVAEISGTDVVLQDWSDDCYGHHFFNYSFDMIEPVDTPITKILRTLTVWISISAAVLLVIAVGMKIAMLCQ